MIQPADRCLLHIEHEGSSYVGGRLIEDKAFCAQIVTLLQGRSTIGNPPLYGRGSLSSTLIICGNPNARSPTQANLVYVCESTEITYDKNVVNFQVTITSVPTVYTRCAQGYHSSIFCSCFDLFAGCILAGMCNGYERKWKELVQNETLTAQGPGGNPAPCLAHCLPRRRRKSDTVFDYYYLLTASR